MSRIRGKRENRLTNMESNNEHSRQDQRQCEGRTTRQETTYQQSHQASIKSQTNRTNTECEQHTRVLIDSIYQHGSPATETKGRKKVRYFKNGKMSISNLSSYTLSKAERNLLGRGLNFIPTPAREHPATILQDYLLFDRKLRLKYYFHDKPTITTKRENITLKPSSGWTPPGSQDQNFDSYRNLTQKELHELNIPPSYNRFKLPRAERKAIKSLSGNPNIIIKPADKGGKIVIQ